MKIKSISLKNFRGARDTVSLETINQESLLLYGDNSTGKSSFLDAVEWFVTDSISHLSGEEIKKNDGLKHILSKEDEDSFVKVKFSNGVENRKFLKSEKNRFTSSFEFDNKSFDILLNELKNKRLWIRNNELVSFILKTKKDRLADISSIIGYDEVVRINTILKQAVNDIKRLIDLGNFQNQISNKKQLITKKIGQLVNNEEQFYSAVDNFVKKTFSNIKHEVRDGESSKKMVRILKEGTDAKALKYRQNLESIKTQGQELILTQTLNESITNYLNIAREIQSDSKGLKNISLIKLYKEASKILSHQTQDNCPLCESEIKKDILIKVISDKLEGLERFSNKNESFKRIKSETLNMLHNYYQRMIQYNCLLNPFQKKLNFKNNINQKCCEIKSIIEEIEKEDIENVNLNNVILPEDFLKEIIRKIMLSVDKELQNYRNDDNSKIIDLITNIETATESFNEFIELEQKKTILDSHYLTLSKISFLFNFKQKQEIENFLLRISEDLNEFYSFMNIEKQINDIKLEAIDRKEEFAGIALKLKFHGQETLSSKKYLSESRINCLGLSLFLSSIKLFNKEFKFFILDDVISSFDKPHRYRFGQLLKEKFKKYQIFVLTHEREWFEQIASQVKGVGWQIQETIWNKNDGIQIRVPLTTLKERIEDKFNRSDPNELGGLLRKYSENLLRQLSQNIKAEFSLKDNDENGKRTLRELYDGFKKRLKKKNTMIADRLEIERLESAISLENQSSHDGRYKENLSDLKSIYDDIKQFISVFQCVDCSAFISTNYFGNGYVSCKCGSQKIDWREN